MHSKRICSVFSLAAFIALMALVPLAAQAAGAKKYAVLPFTINGPDKYQYLGGSIQDMLNSRLYWADHFSPLPKAKVNKVAGGKNPEGDSAGLISSLDADYLVYGSVSIMGDTCSLDVRVIGRDGSSWPKSMESKLDTLIFILPKMAATISSEVFKKPGASTASSPQKGQPQRKNAMNPGLVHNETQPNQEFYLNPQFRYAGDAGESGRIRSQTLGYVSNTMVIGDANDDGRNEVFIASDSKIHAYEYNEDSQMLPGGEFKLGPRTIVLRLSMLDLNGDGTKEIIASAVDVRAKSNSKNKEVVQVPKSFILSYNEGKFTVLAKDILLHLATAKLPPSYEPRLVGQKKGSIKAFSDGVYEVVKMSGEYQLGGKVLLPPEANVYNFTYLPEKDGDYKIVLTDASDYLIVYTKTGDRQFTTDKRFSGGALSVFNDNASSGLLGDTLVTKPVYFIPLRMIPYDLNQDEQYELLVNFPVSVAAQFFTRYRFYPQGEIHSLSWDGVGLSLVWKTRRIKGSVTDYCLEDINNDGILDLNVLVNSHPGAIGAKFRRTLIVSYPLDTSEVSETIDEEFTLEQ